jgi:hypothetical protein
MEVEVDRDDSISRLSFSLSKIVKFRLQQRSSFPPCAEGPSDYWAGCLAGEAALAAAKAPLKQHHVGGHRGLT